MLLQDVTKGEVADDDPHYMLFTLTQRAFLNLW